MDGSQKNTVKTVFLLASILILPCTTVDDILHGNKYIDTVFPALPVSSMVPPTKSL